MPLSNDLGRIVELAQVKVKCPCTCHLKVVFHQDSGCLECQNTGYVPDPRFVSLVAALMEYCPKDKFPEREWHIRAREDSRFSPPCCRGTHRRLRSEWRQQGELAGVLFWQVGKLAGPKKSLEEQRWGVVASDLMDTFCQSDCNEQAAQVVLEAMEREAAHATE